MKQLTWHVALETEAEGEFFGNNLCIGTAAGFPNIGDYVWCSSDGGEVVEYQVIGVRIGRQRIRIAVEFTNLAADKEVEGEVDWYDIDAYVLVDYPNDRRSGDHDEGLDEQEQYNRRQHQFWLGPSTLRGKKQWILGEKLPPGMYPVGEAS